MISGISEFEIDLTLCNSIPIELRSPVGTGLLELREQDQLEPLQDDL